MQHMRTAPAHFVGCHDKVYNFFCTNISYEVCICLGDCGSALFAVTDACVSKVAAYRDGVPLLFGGAVRESLRECRI